MNAPARFDTTPAYSTPLERWRTLETQIRAALDLAQAYTDFPPTIALVRHYREKLDNSSPISASGASVCLAQFGPNGLWPAIDDVMSQARFHGFDWREKARATPVLEMRHG